MNTTLLGIVVMMIITAAFGIWTISVLIGCLTDSPKFWNQPGVRAMLKRMNREKAKVKQWYSFWGFFILVVCVIFQVGMASLLINGIPE